VHVICYRTTRNLFFLENHIVAHMCKGLPSFTDIGISYPELQSPIIRLNLSQLNTRVTHYLLFCQFSVPFRCLTRILRIVLISTYVLCTLSSKFSQRIIFFFLLSLLLIYDQTFFAAPSSPI